jgi:DNA-directed RNA polymerase III subunit RPC6
MTAPPSVPSKRDELKQKVNLGRFIKLFQDDPEHDFAPDELRSRLEALGVTLDMPMILKFLRHSISNGHVRLVPVDEKNRYRCVPPELSDKFSELSEEHHKIYALIEQAQDRGIWRMDLKKQNNIDEKQIGVLLNELKKRQLIKEVTSVSEKKIKYFLFHVDPSREVTGGIWFSGAQFNSPLIDETLIPAVAQLVTAQPGITVGELVRKVKASGIGNLVYEHGEAGQLVSATVSSGRIAKVGGTLRVGPVAPVVDPLSRTPCKGCPNLAVCEPGGAVNPVDCPYFQLVCEDA